MKNKNLLRTDLIISIILLIGFTLTAVLSYKANYQTSLDSIEQISSLTTEGIYYQLTTILTRPVNISLTMAHDSLLKEHLQKEKNYLNDSDYIETIKTYLEAYREKYKFDSVFLISSSTGNYYNFNGIDRTLTKENPENTWYFDFLDSELEYSLNVDNDEVGEADNEITVFVNCKIMDSNNKVMGIVGVGININYLKDLLQDYEEKYNIKASLINKNGIIQISTSYTGYEAKDWFATYSQQAIREKILGWNNVISDLELWTSSKSPSNKKSFVVTRYIPELSWNLVVEQNISELIRKIYTQFYLTCFILTIVIFVVLVVITTVIRRFNKQITKLIEERQTTFKEATEQLYDNIYELNITKNCSVGKRTEEYFESLGAEGLPYDQGLRVIAEKQIKEEYREGYISMFTPEHVIQEYEAKNNHLQYDFMITQDGTNYHWMRIDAYIFYSSEDNSIHMFTYQKNIDAEKQKELQAEIDGMTEFFTRRATEQFIGELLSEDLDSMYAFFIFDIDNFKQANDCYGHAFGDFCIQEFASIIRKQFREKDILGRIGGDEFVVFISIPNIEWVKVKAKELTKALSTTCINQEASWNMSASIGVAIAPQDGTDFDTLYRNADKALYMTKEKGKKGFTIYNNLNKILRL